MLSRESSGKGNSESSHRKGNFLPTFRFLSGLLRVTEIVSVNLIYIYDGKKIVGRVAPYVLSRRTTPHMTAQAAPDVSL